MAVIDLGSRSVPPGERIVGPFRLAAAARWRSIAFRFDASDLIASGGDCVVGIYYRPVSTDPWQIVVEAHFIGVPSFDRHGNPVTQWGFNWSPSSVDPDRDDLDPQWGLRVVNQAQWTMPSATIEVT
jgi:hypothetical protein